MDLHAIFEALQSTPFAVAIAESDTLFPIIETVHTNFFGTQSVAFTSTGQPLHTDGR